MDRRSFLATTAAGAAALSFPAIHRGGDEGPRPLGGQVSGGGGAGGAKGAGPPPRGWEGVGPNPWLGRWG
ncbi:MAG: twin-arginine translocation signal domain-containing protein, partial [Candidatus Rokuibacteriota bacterium]